MADEIVNVEDSDLGEKPSDNFSQENLAELRKADANLYYNSKQYDKALIFYNEAIDICPEVARYYGNRAACYMMLGRYKEAFADAKKCIEMDPAFLKGYARVIKCSLILGDIVSAETTMLKLLELDPTSNVQNDKRDLDHVRRYMSEADAAYSIKDFRKVVYCMDRCCDVSTSCPRFKLTKAECLTFLGRYQEAQDIANNILHIDKQNADAIYVRGMCLYYEDSIDMAFAHFQQVLRLAPDHSKALDIYKRAKLLKQKKEKGNAAFKGERYQEAYDLYTEALRIDPQNTKTNAKLHFNKATVSAKLGRHKESVTECSKALKLEENYLKALLRRASCYMELQMYEEAVYDYERICKIEKSRENKRLLMEAKLALKKSKRKDYYKILGIDKNASTNDIKKAYRKRAMVHHPDRHANASDGEKKEQEKKFKEVGEAYGILSDPKKRSRYDSGHDMDEDSGINEMDQHAMFHAFFSSSDGVPHFPSAFMFE